MRPASGLIGWMVQIAAKLARIRARILPGGCVSLTRIEPSQLPDWQASRYTISQ
jgi:hypothetical protein